MYMYIVVSSLVTIVLHTLNNNNYYYTKRLEVLKVYHFRDIYVYVMYYVYVTSGPSYL